MNKILVSIFPNETAAYDGLSALKDLDQQGDITLYASEVLVKDAKGQMAVRETSDRGPLGTVVGLVAGSLIGIVGGPAGIAVGAYVGGTAGLFYDLFSIGFGSDFIDEVSSYLTPGTVAIVADIDEAWITPVETRFAQLGATSYRRNTGEQIDEELNREADEANAELIQLRAELRESNDQTRAAIQAKIDAQTRKLHELRDRIDKRLDQLSNDLQARLAKLRDQLAHAREGRKADIEARMAELKSGYETRRAKLQRARELTKEAAEAQVEALKP